MNNFTLRLASVVLAAGISVFAAESVAVVNGKVVTTEDVQSFLMKINPNLNFSSLAPNVKNRVIDQVIERQLLMSEAIKSGIKKETEFEKARQRNEDDLALEFWMKKQFNAITVPEADARKFYNNNNASFRQPAQLKARHILVKTEDEAKTIIQELSVQPADKLAAAFAESAKKNSKDPGSGAQGGELGWFEPKQMVKPFSDAAMALAKGSMTLTPVKSDFGYHIIYLEDKKEERIASFEEVRNEIVQMLKMERFKTSMAAKVKKLRAKAKIELK